MDAMGSSDDSIEEQEGSATNITNMVQMENETTFCIQICGALINGYVFHDLHILYNHMRETA